MNKKGIDLLLDIAQHDDRALELLRMAALGDGLAAVLDRASCTRARNAELIQAANILGADGCGPWPTAVRLAGYVKRFKATVLPRLRPGSLIQLSPVEACLYRAFLTGERRADKPGTDGAAGYTSHQASSTCREPIRTQRERVMEL